MLQNRNNVTISISLSWYDLVQSEPSSAVGTSCVFKELGLLSVVVPSSAMQIFDQHASSERPFERASRMER